MIVDINMPAQRRTGRTTLAVGMFQEMNLHRIEAVYVVHSENAARDMCIRFGLEQPRVMGLHQYLRWLDGGRPRFVVLDNFSCMDRALRWEALDKTRAVMSRLDGICQLVMIP